MKFPSTFSLFQRRTFSSTSGHKPLSLSRLAFRVVFRSNTSVSSSSLHARQLPPSLFPSPSQRKRQSFPFPTASYHTASAVGRSFLSLPFSDFCLAAVSARAPFDDGSFSLFSARLAVHKGRRKLFNLTAFCPFCETHTKVHAHRKRI